MATYSSPSLNEIEFISELKRLLFSIKYTKQEIDNL